MKLLTLGAGFSGFLVNQPSPFWKLFQASPKSSCDCRVCMSFLDCSCWYARFRKSLVSLLLIELRAWRFPCCPCCGWTCCCGGCGCWLGLLPATCCFWSSTPLTVWA